MLKWILREFVAPNLDFIIFSLLFPGSTAHWFAEKLYVNFFEYGTRQPTKDRQGPEQDWENPKVVGRRRQKMRGFSRSFTHNKNKALVYWKSRLQENQEGQEALQIELLRPSIFMLTNSPGGENPHISSNHWEFLLVSDPHLCPLGWEIFEDKNGSAVDFTSTDRDLLLSNNHRNIHDDGWTKVSLPSHWQLQDECKDIPIYTNTTYPFQFDPPRARRTGTWKNLDCDIGLGGATNCYSTPTKRSENEPDGENATGLYRTKFQLPSEWHSGGKCRYFLVFEGVDSCMTAWLNGMFVGYSQDSCLSAEFDITEMLLHNSMGVFDSNHMLAVRVSRWCDGSYLEDQDKWWLSGIYREVYILRRPEVFISDYEFSTASIAFDERAETSAALSASIAVSVLAEGLQSGDCSQLAVRVELWDQDDISRYSSSVASKKDNSSSNGKRVLVMTGSFNNINHQLPTRHNADAAFDSETADLDRNNLAAKAVATMSGSVSNPMLWTAETPHLYTLIISLHTNLNSANADKDPLQVESCRVGIRKVHIGGSQNQLQVNNVPITIAGVNRHEFSAYTGRAVSVTSMRQDAKLLKSLNFNAVRCSHYPNHPYWLEICDEVGLYVIDEANIETHGFQTLGQPIGYLANLDEWRSAFGSRVTRMYERDKNFSCIICWSLGNESGYGKAHDAMAAWLRIRDPLRPVQYESGGARTSATDIVCPMYLRPSWCEHQALHDKKKRPVILCEYAHAMGNSGGSLGHYWREFRNASTPRFQGGFIWDFCDQGLLQQNRLTNGRPAYCYGGDFDDLPNTKQFCCNGLVGPSRELYPTAYEVAYLQAPVEVALYFIAGNSSGSGSSYSNSNNSSSSNPLFFDQETGSNTNTGEEPMLLITSRRSHTSLADMEVSVTFYYHEPFFLVHEQGSDGAVIRCEPFKVPCGDILPGRFKSISLLQQLTYAMDDRKASISLSTDANNLKRRSELGEMLSSYFMNRSGTSATAWLDVTVTGDKGRTVLHTHLADDKLTRIASMLVESKVNPIRSDVVACRTLTPTPSTQRYTSPSSPAPPAMTCEKVPHEGVLIVRWALTGCVAKVGLNCGRLLSWSSPHSGELLSAPVDVCLYRAGTDNDRGGGGLSYHSTWKDIGLDALSNKAGSVTSHTPSACADGFILVSTQWSLSNSPPTSGSSAKKPQLTIPCKATYTFHSSGFVQIQVQVSVPSSSSLPTLPRCGLRWAIPSEFDEVQWLGLGPHEAYPDRQGSAFMGVFASSVEELHTPYIFPQECGRRADPRWIIFRNRQLGCNLAIIPTPATDDSGWGFSASRYSLEALESTMHDFELCEDSDRRVHVHVDSKMMGVGGYDSWSPNVDKKYLIKPGQKPMGVSVTLFQYE